MKTININRKIIAARMYEDVKALASFGPRHPGSPGDKASQDYLISFAKRENLKVHTIPCQITRFIPGSCSLQSISPLARSIKCIPQDRSGTGPIDGISGEVVYVGCGHEQDYDKVCAEGKLALLDIWGLHLVKKIDLAQRHGAIGCILIHPYPGGTCCAWGLGEQPALLPVVSISYEDGHWFHKILKKDKCIVSLKCNVFNEPWVSDHVIMELPAKNSDNKDTVILIAHRDTTHISPGANDNASGMAVLLELIRNFKDHSLDYGLIFIFSAAEEGGGIGMSQFVSNHLKEFPLPPRAAINLDMLAVGSKMYIVNGDLHQRTSTELNGIIHKAGIELNYHLEDYEMEMGLADIEHLVKNGIPSTWIFKPDDPRVHTEYDLPEYVNPNDLKIAADIVADTLMRL